MGRPKGSKNKTKKAASKSSRSKKNTYDAPMMGDEVAIIITFAVSAFLFLANLGLCGPVGAVLKSVQLGLFGIMGFLFPILLSFVVVFILSNLDNPYATFRMTTALFMLIFISAIFQLTFGGGVTNMSLADFYKEGSQQGTGGGIIGGALAMVLFTIAGNVGSMLILLAACFICLIYITGKPLARMLAESSSLAALRATERAKEDWNNVTESARIHREERRLAREAQQREMAQRRVDFTLTDQSSAAQESPYTPETQENTGYDDLPYFDEPTGNEASQYDAGYPETGEQYTDDKNLLGPDEYRDNTVELPLNVKHTPVMLMNPSPLPKSKASKYNIKPRPETLSAASPVTSEVPSDPAFDEEELPDTNGNTDSYDEVEAALDAAFNRMSSVTTGPKAGDIDSGSFGSDPVPSQEDRSDIQSAVRVPHFGEDNEPEITVTDITDDFSSDIEKANVTFEEESAPKSEDFNSSVSGNIISGAFDNRNTDSYESDYYDDESGDSDEIPDNILTIAPAEESISIDSPADHDTYDSDEEYYTEDFKEAPEVSDKPAVLSSGDMTEAGTRRIVTSGGQVIEVDVEPVIKKPQTQLDREKIENTPTEADNRKVEQEIKQKKPQKPYVIPPLSLLSTGGAQDMDSREEIRQNAVILQETLKSFDIEVKITDISVGPSVTRYEIQPDIGVKVSKIVSLTDDIKMRLAATDIRIEAPIPGKSAVGIEVPNKHSSVVHLGDVLRSPDFADSKSKIAFGVGKDISGKTIVTDIAKMPHLLIAGSTGSGKSVCINTLIMSMLFKYKPEELRMIMVDPKVVELSVYNGIPHLLIPVVVDPKKAAAALNWAVAEMTERYKKFAETGSRDLKGYNEKIERIINDPEIPEDQKPEKLPQIVIIIDELADLMMVSSQEVEDAICRIAQLARAAGMHLVIATQRPTVNVITGLIKANVPSRIAFAVSSGTDSRTIIDMNGAEKLLGKGDMLFFPQGIPKPIRVQGAFVSDQEVSAVTEYIKKTMGEVEYSEDIQAKVQSGGGSGSSGGAQNDMDELFHDAGQLIIESEKASIGMLQRKFRIGFNRAARIMDQLADANVVGPEEGTKPRKILMTLAEFDSLFS
ncbi:FtsK/SpoIIIE family DNA translocase [Oribacterium sp. P6A1]|uniref:FtsK/SpoIIIE family DNA translocase n=1 Tax=Oribacterium sp. P6A1 TaxID=1410612 RepID=UPI00068D5D3D|nr:DNA translocase FtsK [Oribacterium sp. P6A1]